jgi:hypothetical protein
MNEERITESPSWSDPRGRVMKTPDDVAEMLRLTPVSYIDETVGNVQAPVAERPVELSPQP